MIKFQKLFPTAIIRIGAGEPGIGSGVFIDDRNIVLRNPTDNVQISDLKFTNGFKMILDGEVDHLPESAFLNVGTIEDAIAKGAKIHAQVGS